MKENNVKLKKKKSIKKKKEIVEVGEVGRPTKYLEIYNEQAFKLCLLGYTDKELSDFFDISESTLNLWKLEYPKFSESIREGKDVADSNVVASLYKKAIGFKQIEDDVKIFNGLVEITPIKKYYPPDTKACEFWLKNRQSKKWRDKQEIEETGTQTKIVYIEKKDKDAMEEHIKNVIEE